MIICLLAHECPGKGGREGQGGEGPNVRGRVMRGERGGEAEARQPVHAARSIVADGEVVSTIFFPSPLRHNLVLSWDLRLGFRDGKE